VEAVKPTGTIIGITGFDGIDMVKAFLKRIIVIPEYMFARSAYNQEPEKQQELLNRFSEYIDKGILHHTQNHHFEWHDLKEAQKFQDSGKAIGKITLTVKF